MPWDAAPQNLGFCWEVPGSSPGLHPVRDRYPEQSEARQQDAQGQRGQRKS